MLAYYTPEDGLIYARGVGTGIPQAELERLWYRLQPLAISRMPSPCHHRSAGAVGSPLVLSGVPWVKPAMVVEVSFGEWPPDGLLRHVVDLGERDDKAAIEVRRAAPRS
jgi:bifunctional non-homologous end joining protein LigD